MTDQNKPEHVLSRRDALKTLVAVTGVAAVSTLPDRWAKPLLEVGALPAHAQISGLPAGLPALKCIEAGQGQGIDLMLTLDKSGSISLLEEVVIQDLNNAKTAFKLFVDGLNLAQDQVGLVSFDTAATLDQPLTQDSHAIKTAIDQVTGGGTTNIAEAIRTADAELFSGHANPANVKVIILMSDGYHNHSGDPIVEANLTKAKGTRILTVALGYFADYDTLRAIASTEADFYYTPTSTDLITICAPACNL